MRFLVLGLIALFLSECARNSKPPLSLVVAPMAVPADSLSSVPHLTTDPAGVVWLSWIEKGSDTSRFLFSRLEGGGWTSPAVIARGSSWFINWADYPMISSDGASNVVAHLLNRSGANSYAYDVQMYFSTDRGATWNEPFALNDDGKQAEHGFVAMAPYQNNVFVSWLDGRNASMEGMEDMKGMDHSGHHGAMNLRAAVLEFSGRKIQEWELDSRTCDCCQTAVAITGNGPVVVYRDRSDDEIRDISIVRLVDGKWTAPKSIHVDNWKIAGCPVNGPRVAAQGNDLAVAWYTVATEPAHVLVVFSHDGGETFSEPVTVDEGKAIGRVDIDWIDDERAIVSWMEGSLIKLAVIHTNGEKENAVVLAESSESRSSGFPQMTRTGNQLIFAWTDDKAKRIKTAAISIH